MRKELGSLEVAADSNSFKLQQELLDNMRPLSKVWTIIEKTSNSPFEKVEVSLPEILTNLDQTLMLLGQAFNNISSTRCFNALKQITGDPRKIKEILKGKNEISVKETQFLFGQKFEPDILDLPKANKNLRRFSWQWQTNNSPFEGAPYWDTNKRRVRGRMSRWCSPKLTHNIHGNQANTTPK